MLGIRNRKEQQNMGHVPVNKNPKQKWDIMGVIIAIIIIVGCIIGLAMKRKPVQNAKDSMSAEENMSKQAVLSEEISIEEREQQFIEFEKLFIEQQDDLKKLAEELVNSLEKKAMLFCLMRNGIQVIIENFLYFYILMMLLNQKKMKALLKFLMKILL